MQGVILAAGKGKRLHPITLQRTKAMAPVVGKPIIERVIDMLAANGIDEFIIVVSPDDNEIRPYFQRIRPDLPLRFVVQPERLGMAHALRLAAPFITGGFILSACDNLAPAAHIAELLSTHRRLEAHATLSLMKIDIAQAGSTGIIEWGDPPGCGWISRIVEKPRPAEAPSNIASLPLYIFSSKILAYLPAVQLSPRGEYELQDAIQMLIERDGRVAGVLTPSRIQLTNAADLLALNRHYLAANGAGATVLATDLGVGAELIPPLRIEAGVTIGPGCVIGPHVYIEENAVIGEGVHLTSAVVLRGAQIKNSQRIVDQVVL
jgi:NDP-sugar pyrophosphorylase family protein